MVFDQSFCVRHINTNLNRWKEQKAQEKFLIEKVCKWFLILHEGTGQPSRLSGILSVYVVYHRQSKQTRPQEANDNYSVGPTTTASLQLFKQPTGLPVSAWENDIWEYLSCCHETPA